MIWRIEKPKRLRQRSYKKKTEILLLIQKK